MGVDIGVDAAGYFYETAGMKAASFQEWLHRDPIAEAAALQVEMEFKVREAAQRKTQEPVDPRLQAFRERFAALVQGIQQ